MLIDIERSEIESRLNIFWLKLSYDKDLFVEGFHKYSAMDQVYPNAEEFLKKTFKERFNTSENYTSTSI